MRTALDTNILSAILSNESGASEIVKGLNSAQSEGVLVLSPVVYGEILAHPGINQDFADRFFEDTGIVVDFLLTQAVWVEAGKRFARYAARRRRSAHGQPKRLLADFIIGAHALLRPID